MQKTRTRRSALNLGDSARWSAYAAAGVAGAIGVTQTAEAAITHVTVGATVNGSVNATSSAFGTSVFSTTFAGGASLAAIHIGSINSNEGIAQMAGGGAVDFDLVGTSIAGSFGTFPYLSNLALNDNVSTANFGLSTAATLATMAFRTGYGNDQFLAAGTGYFGFSFDNGGGTQYGWGRVTMSGANHNSYVLEEFAYGDVGDAITVGQVPEPGSLGLLALGAIGLTSWRKRRGEAA